MLSGGANGADDSEAGGERTVVSRERAELVCLLFGHADPKSCCWQCCSSRLELAPRRVKPGQLKADEDSRVLQRSCQERVRGLVMARQRCEGSESMHASQP